MTKEPAAHVEKGISGQETRHHYCADCGSPIGMATGANPRARGFRASAFDDLQGLKPQANVWVSTKLPFENLDASLPNFETQPTREEFAALFSRK